MLKLKLWTVLTILWLCAFLTLERIHAPMNIASFVYAMSAILAVITLLLPKLDRRGECLIWGSSLAVLLTLKPLLGYPLFTDEARLGGSAVPLAHALGCLGGFVWWGSRASIGRFARVANPARSAS